MGYEIKISSRIVPMLKQFVVSYNGEGIFECEVGIVSSHVSFRRLTDEMIVGQRI